MKSNKNPFWDRIISVIIEDTPRKILRFRIMYFVLSIIFIVLSLVNFLQGERFGAIIVLIFGLLCGINYLFTRIINKLLTPLNVIFIGEFFVMGIYTVITGYLDGTSILWLLLVPTCGTLAYGRRQNFIISLAMFICLAFFFIVPWGNSLLKFNYSWNFRIQFLVLYIVLLMLTIILETIRKTSQKEINRLREEYHFLYLHDALTGALNRYGLDDYVKGANSDTKAAAIILDIDDFKNINDSHGHIAGDEVLKVLTKKVEEITNMPVCRWGGEEFVIWLSDSSSANTLAENIRKEIENMPIVIGDDTIHITISLGIAENNANKNCIDLVIDADKALYEAKRSGKNCVRIYNEEKGNA